MKKMTRHVRLLAYCPRATQVGAYLRVVAPLMYLREEMPLDVSYHNDCQIHTMSTGDIMLLQRPFSDGCVERARVAKLARCKVWIDWDDDLHCLPRGNKSWEHYQFEHLADNLRRLMELADVITVTTGRLAEVFGAFPEKVRIVPNAIEDRFMPDAPPVPTRKCLMWRGSDSHMVDLAEFRGALRRFAYARCPEWKFCFFGKDPTLVLDKMPAESWYHLEETEYFSYLETIQSFASPVQIVPLADIPFNRAKSNLCYLEATTAGSAVLAPAWPEWDMPGVRTYDGVEDFVKQLTEMTDDTEMCRLMNLEAFDHVQRHHMLSHVNETRKEILIQLTT